MELKKMVYVAPSPIHGRGLFARRPIGRGTHIGTYEGPLAKRNGKYVLWIQDDDGSVLEGRRGMNLLRYLNHAVKPNAEFDGYDLYAIRRIRSGEEITFNYSPGEALVFE